MKIGLVTFWWSEDNYGQLLQAYALSTWLKQHGHSVSLLKLREGRSRSQSRTLYDYLNPKKVLPYLLEQFKKVLRRYCVSNAGVTRQFDDFRNHYLDWFPVPYNSDKDFIHHYPNADAFICGSDQVWNLVEKTEFGKNWFLNFAKPNIPRIAYAASFGKSEVNNAEITFLHTLLASFSAISIREKSGAKICSCAGRNDVTIVADPTLLVDPGAYISLMADLPETAPREKPFAIGYFLNLSDKSDVAWEEMVRLTKQYKLDFKVIPSGNTANYFPRHYRCFPSIPEWLRLYSQAKYVFTNSFHGTIFAIIMQKPFIVFPLRRSCAPMNGRLDTLLEQLGLESRLYQETKTLEEQLSQPIDWPAVKKAADDFTHLSATFLASALEGRNV